jgi:hypothetical protein
MNSGPVEAAVEGWEWEWAVIMGDIMAEEWVWEVWEVDPGSVDLGEDVTVEAALGEVLVVVITAAVSEDLEVEGLVALEDGDKPMVSVIVTMILLE